MKIIKSWLVENKGNLRHLYLTEKGYYLQEVFQSGNDITGIDYFSLSEQEAKELIANTK
jgi:hypothetical protein